jgi:hypothetical protein
MTKNFVQPGVVKTDTRFVQKSMLKSHEDMSYFGKSSTLGHINLVVKSSVIPNKRAFTHNKFLD